MGTPRARSNSPRETLILRAGDGSPGASTIDTALILPAVPDNRWDLTKQVGVKHAVLQPSELGDPGPPTDPAALEKIVSRFQDAGLSLEVLEGALHPGYEMTGRLFAIGHLRELLGEMMTGPNASPKVENP